MARPVKPARDYNVARRVKTGFRLCIYCFSDAERRLFDVLLKDHSVLAVERETRWASSTAKFYRQRLCRKFGVQEIKDLFLLLLHCSRQARLHARVYEREPHGQRRMDRRTHRYQSKKYFAEYRDARRYKINARKRCWYRRNKQRLQERERINQIRTYWQKRGVILTVTEAREHMRTRR